MNVDLYRIPSSELPDLIDQYDRCLYWSPDRNRFMEHSKEGWKFVASDQNPLDYLLSENTQSPVLINGLVENEIDLKTKHAIISASLQNLSLHWIFLTPMHVEVSSDLLPFLTPKTWPLPTVRAIADFLESRNIMGDEYIRAASGLYFRELVGILETQGDRPVLERIAEYKALRLKQKGILYIPKPNVQVAGVENVVELIEEAADLLLPAAKDAGIPFPKGMVLIGPPGTGKTLTAKTAATIMNVPLVCADWAGLISEKPGVSEDNLRSLIEVAEASAPSLLFFDDFDKGFSSSDLSRENATEKRLAGMLLTWLQERTADVYVMVTCNRVEQIPPELKRRFTDIVFVDLPHEGGRYEVFKVHLDRYRIDYSAWEKREWEILILEYNECTPDEIGSAVDRAVRLKFRSTKSITINYTALVEVRSLFTPANLASEQQISAIRFYADAYKRAASDDNSVFRAKRDEIYDKMIGKLS
jgi:DNA polymerase III delta prime subunit